jgi:hypothetical protein
VEPGDLAFAPEAARIKGDSVAADPATCQFQHQPSAHGTADHVCAGQVIPVDGTVTFAIQVHFRSTVSIGHGFWRADGFRLCRIVAALREADGQAKIALSLDLIAQLPPNM